jgi:hypothetical protein
MNINGYPHFHVDIKLCERSKRRLRFKLLNTAIFTLNKSYAVNNQEIEGIKKLWSFWDLSR